MLTPRQQQHSAWIRDTFAKEQKVKFEVGATEHHGSELQDMPLLIELNEAKNEFIDGYTYILDAVEKIKLLKEWVAELFITIENTEEPLSEDVLVLMEQVKELLAI